MRTIKGVVTWVGDQKKYGNYSFKLKGHDEWFRSPERAKGILEAGHTVQVKVKENDRGDYVVLAKPKLIKKGTPPQKGGTDDRGGQYKEDPEKASRIAVQAAQDRAIQVTRLLIEQGAVKLPKAKPDAVQTIILETLDELTARFYKQVYDPQAFLGKQEEIEKDLEDDEEADEDFSDEDGDGEASDDDEFDDDVPWDED